MQKTSSFNNPKSIIHITFYSWKVFYSYTERNHSFWNFTVFYTDGKRNKFIIKKIRNIVTCDRFEFQAVLIFMYYFFISADMIYISLNLLLIESIIFILFPRNCNNHIIFVLTAHLIFIRFIPFRKIIDWKSILIFFYQFNTKNHTRRIKTKFLIINTDTKKINPIVSISFSEGNP